MTIMQEDASPEMGLGQVSRPWLTPMCISPLDHAVAGTWVVCEWLSAELDQYGLGLKC